MWMMSFFWRMHFSETGQNKRIPFEVIEKQKKKALRRAESPLFLECLSFAFSQSGPVTISVPSPEDMLLPVNK